MTSRKTPQCQSPRDCSDGLLVTISYWAVFVPKSRFRCLATEPGFVREQVNTDSTASFKFFELLQSRWELWGIFVRAYSYLHNTGLSSDFIYQLRYILFLGSVGRYKSAKCVRSFTQPLGPEPAVLPHFILCHLVSPDTKCLPLR